MTNYLVETRASVVMPLLRKKLFQKLHVSSDFRDDDEVFHCEVTNEIFKDYKLAFDSSSI